MILLNVTLLVIEQGVDWNIDETREIPKECKKFYDCIKSKVKNDELMSNTLVAPCTIAHMYMYSSSTCTQHDNSD